MARARTLNKRCSPLARGPQSTSRRLVDGDARSEQVFSSVGAQCSSAASSDHVLCCAPKARGARRRAGCFVCYRGLDWRGRALRASVVARGPATSIYFQGLGRRGHLCRECLRDRGRAGLNLLLGSWSARARIQRRVAACGAWGSIYFQGLDWRGRAPRAGVGARGPAGSIYFQGLSWPGHPCRKYVCDCGRGGLNLLPRHWSARVLWPAGLDAQSTSKIF